MSKNDPKKQVLHALVKNNPIPETLVSSLQKLRQYSVLDLAYDITGLRKLCITVPGQSPYSLINLSFNGYVGVQAFIEAFLALGINHDSLTLKFSGLKPNPKEIEDIANLLLSGKCPPNLKVILNDCSLDMAAIELIAKALESGNCPPGLVLDLSSNQIKDQQFSVLAHALAFGKSPSGLTLILANNKITAYGVTRLNQFIDESHQKFPPKFTLDLSNNKLGNEGLKEFGFTLFWGKFSYGTTLKLEHNAIRSIDALLEPLCSKLFPRGFTLNVANNKVQDYSLNFVINMLKERHFPHEFTLDLRRNALDNEQTAKRIDEMIDSGKYPYGLKIDLTDNSFVDRQGFVNNQFYKNMFTKLQLKNDLLAYYTLFHPTSRNQNAVLSSTSLINHIGLFLFGKGSKQTYGKVQHIKNTINKQLLKLQLTSDGPERSTECMEDIESNMDKKLQKSIGSCSIS